MGEMLKQIRDLTIIAGIYLYFIAWVYIHFYYQQFGISTASVKIDYNTYLMYSYNVLTSVKFLYWCKVIVLLVLLRILFLRIIAALAIKTAFFKRTQLFLSGNIITQYVKKINGQYPLLLLAVVMIIVFPWLFKVSRQVAIDNYKEDRLQTDNLKTVQFIFRKNADIMSQAVVLDSALPRNHVFFRDISTIKNDTAQLLKLLGESDKYYIVLQQRPFNKTLGALPTGYVYYIDKQDILLSKIILRSL